MTTDGNTFLKRLGRIIGLAALTFAIPLLQWFANKLIEPSGFGRLLGNLLPIIFLSYWVVRNNLFYYHPALPIGRVILYLLGVSVFFLLTLNLLYPSVSGITGRMRLSYEVIDVIVLGSMAEELLFRGMAWSLFKQLFKANDTDYMALVGTSVLFGVAHLGYWAQSHWPLPAAAYLHSLCMILAGIFFGVFRLKTRSLTIPVILHVLANGIVLLLQ